MLLDEIIALCVVIPVLALLIGFLMFITLKEMKVQQELRNAQIKCYNAVERLCDNEVKKDAKK